MKERVEESDDDPTANEGNVPRGDAVLTEQRRNLNRQVTTLRQIDETAARAVRIGAIIIGFVTTAATAVSQTSQSPVGSALFLVGVGVVFLLATMVLGVLTTGETGYKTRLTDGEYMRLSKPYPPEGCERPPSGSTIGTGHGRQPTSSMRIPGGWLAYSVPSLLG